jgi:hypothetical protein
MLWSLRNDALDDEFTAAASRGFSDPRRLSLCCHPQLMSLASPGLTSDPTSIPDLHNQLRSWIASEYHVATKIFLCI